MPTLHIVRGLPGSGKSTFARELSAKTGAMLIEPDMFLVKDGAYRYTEDAYSVACRLARYFVRDLMDNGSDCIYCDVLPRLKDVEDISKIAAWYGPFHKIEIHDMPLISVVESKNRNKHKVRIKDIQRMAREWESWPWESMNKDKGIVG